MEKSLYVFMGILGVLLMPTLIHTLYADVSPVEGAIIIKEDQNKTVFYQPNNITITAGGEILIANKATSDHSVTSGSGPEDPMAGKFFDTDKIKPNAFVEYATHNLNPGNYSFYSSTDPKVKGELIVLPSK